MTYLKEILRRAAEEERLADCAAALLAADPAPLAGLKLAISGVCGALLLLLPTAVAAQCMLR